jgi:hypothetical protein
MKGSKAAAAVVGVAGRSMDGGRERERERDGRESDLARCDIGQMCGQLAVIYYQPVGS